MIGVASSLLFFFSFRLYKSDSTKTGIRCQKKKRVNVVVIVAVEAAVVVVVVVNASGVARFVVVATMLPLSVTN